MGWGWSEGPLGEGPGRSTGDTGTTPHLPLRKGHTVPPPLDLLEGFPLPEDTTRSLRLILKRTFSVSSSPPDLRTSLSPVTRPARRWDYRSDEVGDKKEGVSRFKEREHRVPKDVGTLDRQ